MFVVIRGGLGNQMFQVANALVVGKKFNRTPIYIDFSSSARVKRTWDLSCFGIEPTKLSFFENLKFFALMSLSRLLPHSLAFTYCGVLMEGDKKNSLFLEVPPKIISGYWQKPKIFDQYGSEIRETFSFPHHDFLDEIKNEFSGLPVVAIHIRRGDYVSDPVAQKVHHVCDEDWYLKAWSRMRSIIGPCKALVFSDDPEWVKSNIHFEGNVTYISNALEREAWVDMKAMSLCDHFIISNSTFSWWAAYLGKNNEGVVLAPSNWFRGVSTKALEICPPSWILL